VHGVHGGSDVEDAGTDDEDNGSAGDENCEHCLATPVTSMHVSILENSDLQSNDGPPERDRLWDDSVHFLESSRRL
jgi:hypothetical protein